MVWPALSVSTMSGSPAAAKNVFQPVVVLDDLVGHTAGGDFAGPADHLGHPECAFPVGVLFAAERCSGAVGPGVGVGAVVGAVDHDGVLGDAQFVRTSSNCPTCLSWSIMVS